MPSYVVFVVFEANQIGIIEEIYTGWTIVEEKFTRKLRRSQYSYIQLLIKEIAITYEYMNTWTNEWRTNGIKDRNSFCLVLV